ncbi:MAG: hypothetical protein IKE04_05000 [Oscillospiraceae bacterium]|nr:hypothetical protein [Oscillospiraceae bacterium]
MAIKASAAITLATVAAVQSVTRYYLLQASTASIPAKPTANPPGAGWGTTEPAFSADTTSTLYTTEVTAFTDGTFIWADVSVSSSYEAAKAAYNQAVAAGQSAGDAAAAALAAQQRIGEIGGRNLIWGTLFPSIRFGERPCINGLHGVLDGAADDNTNAEFLKSTGELTPVEHGLRLTSSNASRTTLRVGNLTPAVASMMGLTAGETYTFSCDAEFKLLSGTKTSSTYYVYAYLYHDAAKNGTFAAGTVAAGTVYTMGTYTQALKGTVLTKRVEWTFTVPANATMLYFLFACNRTTASNYKAGDYIELRNIKLEKGSQATVWTPAPEDYEGTILAAQQSADAAQQTADGAATVAEQAAESLQTLRTETASTVEQLRESIALRVTETAFNAHNTAVGQRIGAVEARAAAVETSVQNLETGIGTHFIVEQDRIRLTQDQEQAWEQQLTAREMAFVNRANGVVAASFGVEGGYADRLRSNKSLSVGTLTEGWYDMIALPTGVADKWRNGSATALRPIILLEPKDAVVAMASGSHPKTGTTTWPESYTLAVEAEHVTAYQWQYRFPNDDWANHTAAGYNTKSFTLNFTAERISCQHRCRLTGADGSEVYTKVVRPFMADAPMVLVQPRAYCAAAVGEQVVVSFYAVGVISYQWQYRSGNKSNGSWANVGSSNNPQAQTRTSTSSTALHGYYRCVLTGANGAISVTDEYSIEWK